MLFSVQFVVAFFIAFITLVQAGPARGGKKHGAAVNGIGVPVSNTKAANVISNRYIVVYNANATDDAVTAHQASVMTAMRKRSIHARSIDGRTLSPTIDAFSMMGWRGMTLEAEDAMMLEISAASEVAYIEADVKVTAQALVQQTTTAPLGLRRISHAAAGSSAYVFDDSAGSGITAFVVDTGIRTTHSEFGGRAVWGANFVNNNNTDENGHGSHVSGTIGGTTFGVSKSVNLVAVKVLDKTGAGTNSGVISGLNFVAQNVTATGLAGKAVVNISIGGSFSSALNSAIAALTRAGVTVVCAAGNENVDASSTSPASAPSAITVGAIDASTDARASFSNFGSVVDIFAPGVSVLSVGIKSDTDTATLSGTSMASPHIAGLAAYLMALNSITAPADVVAKMKSLAAGTGAVVSKPGTGSPTIIAYNGSGL
ncbi:putative subtilisin-like protease [Tricladium varicosporioides]|nr:putative subtilisin-like protease [Hymenoscyphus varicosporioides]